MSFEVGGRGDKYGNTYEDRHRASLLEQIARERLKSIKIESLDSGRDIAEYTVTDNDGRHRYYQCKGSNGNNDSWSVADLNRYEVFTRVRKLLTEDPSGDYYFVSPLRYKQLDELCKRARTNCGYEEFEKYQLSHNDKKGVRPDFCMMELFTSCLEKFGFTQSSEDKRCAKELLARCYFETWNCGPEAQAAFERDLDAFFMGNPTVIRNSLENFAQDTGWYGREITASMINGHLEKQKIQLRSRIASKTVLPKVRELNQELWKEYYPIKGRLIHRNATDEVLRVLEAGGSVVIHGAAGCGKSGCLEELRNELERRSVLYLSLKLDQYPPSGTADSYGQSLGLLQSPVLSLAQVAGNQPCVLILDQLDSLRWSGKNSGTATRICRQLISQAAKSNECDKTKISIVFSSRTVDLENDQGLRYLFEISDEAQQNGSIKWSKVQVDPLSEQETAQIIGPDFEKLSRRMKRLLTVPASLYVWLELPGQKRKSTISSSFELMRTWWDALLEKGEENSFSRQQLCECKDDLVCRLEKTSVFMLPLSLFTGCRKCIDFFISEELLQKGANNTVSFVHQSFWDYFVAQSLQENVYEGKKICDLLSGSEKQTPIWRYRLLTVLQNLFDSDEKFFLKQARTLLASPDVRYYMKCTVFEVIGQSEQVSDKLYHFVETYKEVPEWKQYINDAVFYGHPHFLRALERFQKPDWNEKTYFSLLRSVVNKDSDFVADKISRCKPQNIDDAYKIGHLICYGLLPKRHLDAVPVCLSILEKFPQLWDKLMLVDELIDIGSEQALDVLEVRLQCSAGDDADYLSCNQVKACEVFVQNFYSSIPVRLFPCIVQKTVSFPQSYNQLDHTLDFFEYTNDPQLYSKNMLREVINLVKKAIAYWGEAEPEGLLAFIKEHSAEHQTVFSHEILMYAVMALPEKYSDNAIKWLLEDFKNRAFVFTDDPADYLGSAKALIQKFSGTCSNENFEKLEKTICTWCDSHERMIRDYRSRLETQKNSEQEPCFYPYWGYLQKELLPCLDQNRISLYAASLLQGLRRNPYIFEKPYHCGILEGPGGACVSPIDGKKLSDDTWLSIICVPKEKLSNYKHRFENGCWIEAAPYAFATALEAAAKQEPVRFAQLLLRFPDHCLCEYYCAVLDALVEASDNSDKEIPLIFEVIRFVSWRKETQICMRMLRLLEHSLQSCWPEDILNVVVQLALNHPDPSMDSQHEFGGSRSTLDALVSQSVNHVRSYALLLLARYSHRQAVAAETVRFVIWRALQDMVPCVQSSLAQLIAVYYDTDPEFAADCLKKLAEKIVRQCAYNSIFLAGILFTRILNAIGLITIS